MPAIMRWSRRKPCTRIELAANSSPQLVVGDRRGLGSELGRAGGDDDRVGGRHAPHAGASFLALFGEQQRGLVERAVVVAPPART